MSGDLVSLRLFLVSAAPPHNDLWREGAALARCRSNSRRWMPPPPKPGCAAAASISASWTANLTRSDKTSVIKAARARKTGAVALCYRTARQRAPRRRRRRGGQTRRRHRRAQGDRDLHPRQNAHPGSRSSTIPKPCAASCARSWRPAASNWTSTRPRTAAPRSIDCAAANRRGVSRLQHAGPQRRRHLARTSSGESPQAAIVMMSSSLKRGASGRPHSSGALGFLKKPFYPADVDAVLERHFGLREAN